MTTTQPRKSAAKASAVKAAPKRDRGPLPPSEHAKQLFTWIQGEADAMGITLTAWCRKMQIPDPTVLRWKKGIEPDFRSLQRVANVMGRSILDVLLAAGYIGPDEAKGHVPQPMLVDARQAIKADPSLSEMLASHLLEIMDRYEEMEAGFSQRAETITKGGRRGVRTRTRTA